MSGNEERLPVVPHPPAPSPRGRGGVRSRFRKPLSPRERGWGEGLQRVLSLAGLVLLAALGACDSTNPVTPTGAEGSSSPSASGEFSVRVTASPEKMDVGSSQGGTLTVQATETATMQPPADGTTVTFSTSLGHFGLDGAGNPRTLLSRSLTGGQSMATFFPGDEVGTANVLAQVGQSVGSLSVEIIEPVPPTFLILGLQPNVGNPEGGEAVTIQGEGFIEPLRVNFASTLATVLEVTSSRTLLVEVPPSVTPVPAGGTLLVAVTVTNALDQPNPPTTTLEGAFTYAFEAPPPFFLLETLPATGDEAGGETVTIRGGGFRSPVRVEFGGTTASSATVLHSGEISVVTPAASQPVPAGGSLPVAVTVSNALDDATTSSATLAGGFTYLAPAAPGAIGITRISPTEGSYRGGDTVRAQGQSFASPAAVDLAGVRQQSVEVETSATLTFVTAGISVTTCPASGRLTQQGMTVTLTSSGASGTAAGIVFDYLVPLPRIEGVTPSSGAQGGGETVTVTGTNLESPVRVLFVGDAGEFAGSVVSDPPPSLMVATPAVPDTFFPQQECTTEDGGTGQRRLAATATVKVVNLGTGCEDSLANIFTYQPADGSCQLTEPPPPPPPPTDPPPPPPPTAGDTQCSDLVDNDGDGDIDWGGGVSPPSGDSDCECAEDDSEFTDSSQPNCPGVGGQ